jgi:hypothetical protein
MTEELIAARLEALAAIVRERLSPDLRALLLFGSCLSADTRGSDSIPDLFAFVDDTPAALERLGASDLARRASRFLPPSTVALRTAPGSRALAKLNIIEPSVAFSSIRALPDLYLAGRLSKRSLLLGARSAACAAEIDALLNEASLAVVSAALLAPPRRYSIEAAARRCFDISYIAEVRPEPPSGLRARFDAFGSFYFQRFTPLLLRRSGELGIRVVDGHLVDERLAAVRRAEAAHLARLLFRSRVRSVARWPKQALLYRGWASYVAGKLRRSLLI